MLWRTAGGTSPRITTSDTASLPPGLSTRKASAKTWRLSTDRLMTQFEMITSTVLAGSGISSMVPLRNSTFVAPAFRLVRPGEGQHLVSHVQAIRLAGGPDALRREQHVDAAAAAEVEYDFACVQVREGGGVAAPERREDCGLGQGSPSARRCRGWQ